MLFDFLLYSDRVLSLYPRYVYSERYSPQQYILYDPEQKGPCFAYVSLAAEKTSWYDKTTKNEFNFYAHYYMLSKIKNDKKI